MDITNEYFIGVINQILCDRFPEGPKRKIIARADSIQLACPICGDSENNLYKKRAKFFFDNLQLHCYHMGCHSNLTKLCNQHHITIDPDKKLQIYQYIDSKVKIKKDSSDEFLLQDMNLLIELDEVLDMFNNGDSFIKNVRPVQKDGEVAGYLASRLIPDKIYSLFYEADLKITNKFSNKCVIYFNTIGTKVLGLQIRNLKSGKNRKYKVVNFEELYELYHNEKMDYIEAIPYNKVSCFYNIFNIDYTRIITVFEGYLDSLFCNNSIGAAGTNTDLSFFLNDDINTRFFFDNDNAGKLKSIEFLKKGKSVFLWDKFIDDWSAKNGDFYNNQKSLSCIKDLNKLAEIVGTYNVFAKLKLDEYFSKDVFDLKYIRLEKPKKFVPNKLKSLESLKDVEVDWTFLRNQLTQTRT